MKTKTITALVGTGIAAIAAILVAAASMTTVQEGEIGVKYRFGTIVEDDLGAGLHFCAPFIEDIKRVDIREQIYEMNTTAYTKDTQTVEGLQVKLNYRYDQSELSDLIRNVGIGNVESKLVVPQLNSALKNAIGNYKAEDLVQNRSSVQESVEEELRENLSEVGVVVTAFNIENIDFEDSFEEVIRQKVAAEQEALRVQNETVAKEEEAKQKVIAAEAEAESQRIEAEAEAYAIDLIQQQLNASPEYIRLQMVEKWDGHWPEVMGNEVNPFVMMEGEEETAASNG